MKKEKKYYLIKAWNEHRGATEENPLYYEGPCNYFPKSIESGVDADRCYKSYKRAENVALKWYMHACVCGYKYAIVEVPSKALVFN